ncbi:hypothetical protein NFI96_002448, partial [Prochilodus magdalenae]
MEQMTKFFIFLSFSSRLASAATHTLDYYLTEVTAGFSVPEFTIVGRVDGLQGGYYNSNSGKVILTAEWLKDNDDEEHWATQLQIAQGNEAVFKSEIANLMRLYNQTGGLHTEQWMYGCELGDDGTKTGYSKYGYDGEDFLTLDPNTYTFTPANDKALIIKRQREEAGDATNQKIFLSTRCFELLQKYVDYGRDTLEGKVRPKVFLLQKDPSSPVVCHATGFYPKAVSITWQKNGEDLDEDVELRETLPNLDDTFQKRSILTVSPEELNKHTYTCIIQHSSLEKEMVLHVSNHINHTGTHSLDVYLTGVTTRISVQEVTIVAHVDGLEGGYYNSDTKKVILTADWIKDNDDTEHWELVLEVAQRIEDEFRSWKGYLLDLFNHTEGIHTGQCMTGCELDDDGTKRVYGQCGYDGEDFIGLDVNTNTVTASNIVAVIVKQQLEQIGGAADAKNFLDTICIEFLQKYVDYGKETLNRTVPPEVSLFQKDITSPVVCHATGFFPKPVSITWQKNGEDLDEDVELGETLPNLDDTFQRRSILTVSPEELYKHNYTCIIQHSSLEKEIVLQVKPRGSVGVLIGSIIGAAVLVILVGVGVSVWVKRRNNPEPGSSSQEEYLEKWKKGMEEAHAIAKENAHKAASRNKRNYDKKFKSSVLCPGDCVLVRNLTPRGGPGKLRNHWEDIIHVVVQQVNEHIPVYELRPEKGKGMLRVLHRNLLLPCDHLPLEVPDQSHVKPKGKPATRNKIREQPAEEEADDDDDDDEKYYPVISPYQYHTKRPERRMESHRTCRETEPRNNNSQADLTHVGREDDVNIQADEDEHHLPVERDKLVNSPENSPGTPENLQDEPRPQCPQRIRTHFLDYYLTELSTKITFPELSIVVHVDGLEAGYYNSDTKKVVLTGDWIKDYDDKEHWELALVVAQRIEDHVRSWKGYLLDLFNNTEGLHALQCMTGCELDDDGTKRVYGQCGYDGEDFLSLDVKTYTVTAANAVAVIVKHQLEQADAAEYMKIFLDIIFIDWLKKYMDYGKEILNRKVRPEVSLFQKNSSSPVVCHATGFFPKAVSITWQKNGEDLDEDVELRETLPNLDETFQRRSILTVSPEDLKENDYTCVIQHISLKKAMVLHVNESPVSVGVLIGIIIGAAVLVILVVVGVYVWVKRRNNPESYSPTSKVWGGTYPAPQCPLD